MAKSQSSFLPVTGKSAFELTSAEWSRESDEPVEMFEAFRIIRSGEKCRYSEEALYTYNGVLEREEYSSDGITVRYRSATHSINTPEENQELAESPHAFLSSTLVYDNYGPDWTYLLTEDEVSEEILVSQQSLGDLRCWKLDFGTWGGGRYWLSKEHDLLPVRIEFGESDFPRVLHTESFQKITSSSARYVGFRVAA